MVFGQGGSFKIVSYVVGFMLLEFNCVELNKESEPASVCLYFCYPSLLEVL